MGPAFHLDEQDMTASTWHRLPGEDLPRIITTSVAFSAFKMAIPHPPRTGAELLKIPLRISVFFFKYVKTRI